MPRGTRRQQEIIKALRLVAPGIPYADAQSVLEEAGSARMKTLPPSTAVWLSLVSHVRHRHTEYDTLLAEGYGRDAARHFVLSSTNDVLTGWRSRRLVSEDDDA